MLTALKLDIAEGQLILRLNLPVTHSIYTYFFARTFLQVLLQVGFASNFCGYFL